MSSLFPRFDAMLANLEALHPCPATANQAAYDIIMPSLLDKTLNDVADYINWPIQELPTELDSNILLRVASWLTSAGGVLGVLQLQSGPVSQIIEGDTTVAYTPPREFATVMDSTWTIQLNRWRRIRGWKYDGNNNLVTVDSSKFAIESQIQSQLQSESMETVSMLQDIQSTINSLAENQPSTTFLEDITNGAE